MIVDRDLAEDFEWFVENYFELFEEYGVCWLAIANKYVLDAFESFAEAVDWVTQNKLLGTVIIEEVDGSEDAYTAYLYQLGRMEPYGYD